VNFIKKVHLKQIKNNFSQYQSI